MLSADKEASRASLLQSEKREVHTKAKEEKLCKEKAELLEKLTKKRHQNEGLR